MNEEQEVKLMQLPEKITKEVVKAAFDAELIRDNYQKLLQDAENISFTEENLKDDHTVFKTIREVMKRLTESKEAKKRPYIDAGKAIQDAYNDLHKPLEDVLNRKLEEFKKVNDVVAKKNAEIEAQKQKNAEILNTLNGFINQTTTLIANATDDAEIVRIQKAIGSEKARYGYYGSYIEQLKTACDNLTPLINERKSHIRELAEIKQKQADALASGDIITATNLMEEIEYKDMQIAENVIRMQETSFKQVLNTSVEVVVAEPNAEVVAPRRKSWKWRVDDIQSLAKKMPHLVDITPNKQKIDELLATKRAEGALKDIEELKIFGLTLYIEKLY